MPAKRTLVLLILVSAVAGLALTHVYLDRLEREVSGGRPVAVLVAARELALGDPLSKDSVAVRHLPQAYVEQRHIPASDVGDIVGARMAGRLRAGESILWTDLAQYSDRLQSLSALVQSGMRAVAIDADSAELGALVQPGDHVDVLLTTRDPSAERSRTMTLLQNLLVLSRGGQLETAETGFGKTRGLLRTGGVTLSATMEQAQVLTHAKLRGDLSLTLRHPEDIALVEGVPETAGQDVLGAKDRTDWHRKPATGRKVIERVR